MSKTEVIILLLHENLVIPHLEYCVVLVPTSQEVTELQKIWENKKWKGEETRGEN